MAENEFMRKDGKKKVKWTWNLLFDRVNISIKRPNK